jgi:hypothetical protein
MAAMIASNPSIIHIDKAARLHHDDGRQWVNAVELLVKVDTSQLDAPIRRVAFQGDQYMTIEEAGEKTPSQQAVTLTAQPFVGATDYYQFEPIGTSGGDRDAGEGYGHFTGQVFVETTNGTQYATAVGGGGPLVIDDNMVNNLRFSADPGPLGWDPQLPDVSTIPETADFVDTPSSEQYLNPTGSR